MSSSPTTTAPPAQGQSQSISFRHLFGFREALWTSSHLSSPKRVWAALHPELERGALTQHDFLAAYSSEDLHSSAALPFKGLAGGAGAAAALLGVAHVVARRLRVPGLLLGAMRQAPLALPFIVIAPVSLGYTIGGMAQASRQETFCTGLDDRAAFARALTNAADREPGWVGADVFGEKRVQAWATRLTSHGQAGTLAPRKEDLETFVQSQGEETQLSLRNTSDAPRNVDDDVVMVDKFDVNAAPASGIPNRRPWWKLW
ncbi:hypothetical protein PENSPDRAFT_693483 [Peniophora sp. CONT]|nr:hypothetical protein PENSPDRAFT_693483 [Peniophora sp. CONT]